MTSSDVASADILDRERDALIDTLSNIAPFRVEVRSPDHYDHAVRIDTEKGTRLVKVARYTDRFSASVEDYAGNHCKTFTGAGNVDILAHALNGYLHATMLGYEHA
jgi:flagellar hook-associated protein FlgK